MAKFNIKAQPIPTVASAYADILGTTDNQIVEIKNELIIEDNKQRFQIHDDTIEQLAERIAKDGQLSPCIVVPLSDGKYELIDGRHRRRAVIKAGLPTTKCIIKTNLTDKEKQTIRLTSNLIRNNDYLPSELAFAYKELAELEDMKTISEETNLSKKKIYRYIRLIYLMFVGNSALSYLFTYKRSLIIVSQKQYVVSACHYTGFVLRNLIQIVLKEMAYGRCFKELWSAWWFRTGFIWRFFIVVKSFFIYGELQKVC